MLDANSFFFLMPYIVKDPSCIKVSVDTAYTHTIYICIYASYDIEHPKLFASNFQMMMKKVTMDGDLMSL